MRLRTEALAVVIRPDIDEITRLAAIRIVRIVHLRARAACSFPEPSRRYASSYNAYNGAKIRETMFLAASDEPVIRLWDARRGYAVAWHTTAWERGGGRLPEILSWIDVQADRPRIRAN
jgi:hypothetical protein